MKNKNIQFSLLENGFDFIISALKHIESGKTKSEFKYAILHLWAGIELVLKERLRREHWTLVAANNDNISRQSYESGRFISVSYEQCVKRLENVCNISLKGKDIFGNLREKRNRFEHFKIVDTRESLISSTDKILSIIIDFINEELSPDDLPAQENKLFKQIGNKLSQFDKFVKRRLKEIDPKLKSNILKKLCIVDCPICYQTTFVLGTLKNPTCLFCKYSTTPEHAAREYIDSILQINEYMCIKDGGEYPLYLCPSCSLETLVDNRLNYICFNEGEKWAESEISKCTICGELYFIRQDDSGMCPDCINYHLSQDK